MAKVLVLGGCGFIGRNFVDFLRKNEAELSSVRVVDKKIPGMANLSAEQEAAYDKDEDEKGKFSFVQCDLCREEHVTRAFAGERFDLVVNFAGEAELGKTAAVYKQLVTDVCLKCAEAAAKQNAVFIHVSDARCYKALGGDKASNEESKVDPRTKLAEAHINAEKKISEIKNLRYFVVRPSTVYGPGDRTGMMPRLVIAATYSFLGEEMKMPFSDKVHLSTVHVRDVCSALWEIHKSVLLLTSGTVYNLADPTNITLGTINELLGSMFDIQTGFVSGAQNLIIKTSPGFAASFVNDKHLKPWIDCCKEHKILDPVLTPYLDPEIFSSTSLLIDGSKVTHVGEFFYRHQKMTSGLLTEAVDYWRKMNQFPK